MILLGVAAGWVLLTRPAYRIEGDFLQREDSRHADGWLTEQMQSSIAEHRARFKLGDIQLLLSGLDIRHVEKRLDQFVQPTALVDDRIDERPAFLFDETVLQQHVGISANRRERCPQLVRHERHHVVLGPVEFLLRCDVVQRRHDPDVRDRCERQDESWP